MSNNSFSQDFTNPRVKKLSTFSQSVFGIEAATYKGIAMKTLFFVAIFGAGMGAYFYIHNFLGGGATIYPLESGVLFGAMIATLISGIVASLAPRTTAVTGTIYSAGMGYSITLLSMMYAHAYKGIVIEALVLTLLTVGVLAVLYAKGNIHVGQRFRTALIAWLWVSIIGGLLFAILSFAAPNSALYRSIVIANNGPIGIVIAAIGVFVAAALLICDFETIRLTVEHGLPAYYEWYASYGLIVGVIYLYLKILDLLVKIANNRRN